MSVDTIQDSELNEFAELIQLHLITNTTYAFRTVNIDGVLFYPVIHKCSKIVNFECVNITCRMKTKENDTVLEKYSAYYKKYKSIVEALTIIKSVISSYKLFNGDLLSPIDYKMAKMEEKINPYTDKQVCCVCYENTMDITVCEHYLCMRCRETCIRKDKRDCPMCRNPGIVNIYNIDNGLINNNEYSSLKAAIEFERADSRNVSTSPFRVYSFQHAIAQRVRSMSSESAEEIAISVLNNLEESGYSDEYLSEVSEIGEDGNDVLEEQHDLSLLDVNI